MYISYNVTKIYMIIKNNLSKILSINDTWNIACPLKKNLDF